DFLVTRHVTVFFQEQQVLLELMGRFDVVQILYVWEWPSTDRVIAQDEHTAWQHRPHESQRQELDERTEMTSHASLSPPASAERQRSRPNRARRFSIRDWGSGEFKISCITDRDDVDVLFALHRWPQWTRAVWPLTSIFIDEGLVFRRHIL